MTFAARMQHRIYWGRLNRWLEWSLRTWLAPWAYIASVLYHDLFWYPLLGRGRVRAALSSSWGRLFHHWENAHSTGSGYPDAGRYPAGLVRGTWRLLGMALRILWICIREAPELHVRKRRRVDAGRIART